MKEEFQEPLYPQPLEIEGVLFENLSEEYEEFINFDAIEKAVLFMRYSELENIMLYGGALLKNELSETEGIEDYDVAVYGAEENKELVGLVIRNLVENHGFTLVGNQDGDMDFLNENPYYYLKKEGILYDFGYKKVYETTLVLEGLVVFLKKFPDRICCEFKDLSPLREFKEGILTVNPRRGGHIDKFEVLERIILVTMKYGHIKLADNEELIERLKARKEEPDFIDERGINITQKKKEHCYQKFLNLLTRLNPEDGERYLKELMPTGLLEEYFPELNEKLTDLDVRRDLLMRNRSIIGASAMKEFVEQKYLEACLKKSPQEKSIGKEISIAS